LSATQLAHVKDREELPRLEFTDEAIYLFMRHAYLNSRGERETAPLLLVLCRETLLLILPRPFAQDFRTDKASRTLRGTTLQMIEHVLDQYSGYLDDVSHHIKALRRGLHNHEISNHDLVNFVTLEEDLNDFALSLEPLNAILQRLVLAHHFPLTASEDELLADLILKNQQLVSACTSHLKSIESIRNAHGTIATNNLNRTIKFLTAATVLLNVPSVIFFALGMNILVPYHNSPWALPVIVGGAFILTITVFLVFKRRRIF
jgi:magnesium transporter